jgi:N utilization substance protein B
MPAVDRNLLRIALYEMIAVDDVDVAVAINECVELAKAYGTEESPRFVNGLLGRVADQLAAGEDLLKAQDQPATGQSVPSGESVHDGQN